MDERIRQGYHKIYSEMFFMIFLLAAVSLVVNVAFFHKNITQLWFEYIILVGSPIYRLIRIRMLEIVDAPAAGWKKTFKIRIVSSLACVIALMVGVSYFRTGQVNVLELVGFIIPFAVMCCLVAVATQKLQDFWKRKLDKKYGDKE